MRIAIITRSNKGRADGSYGCCVAGITEYGKWIRLVADENGDSLPNNNSTPKVNTVIEVIDATIKYVPLELQPENAILGNYRKIADDVNIDKCINLVGLSTEEYIFGALYNCLNDEEMKRINGSLRFYKVNNLEIYRNEKNKWKVKFSYNGNGYYDIAMTDPNHYQVKFIGNAYIVVSLPNESIDFRWYKFVARIIPLKN